MRFGFYPKLAFDGIRKNRRMYLPYFLACMGMVMMTYIINFLKTSQTISVLPGAGVITSIMNLGVFVMAFFSALFLFYTNSFLIRRRKKEFGLYNILGMGKRNIARILIWETLFVAVGSIALGLLTGMLVSKLAELGLVNIMNGNVNYTLSVSPEGIIYTVIPFGIIFFLLLLNSLRQLWCSNAISLLRSENTGEKPPKGNWLLGMAGFAILGAAYYLAVTIHDPISALGLFFVAVIMVIAATYLIMIAGSVLLCRVLQKNKRYYYKPNHFVSVSSMAYRMKRNGAGLASICILVTMVLVMISSTSALFMGAEDVIKNRYPRQINSWTRFTKNESITREDTEPVRDVTGRVLEQYGAVAQNVADYRTAAIAGMLNGGDVIFDMEKINDLSLAVYSDVVQLYLLPLEDYNAMSGRNVTLEPDEALVYTHRIRFDGDTIGFQDAAHYKVKEHLADCFLNGDITMDIMPSVVVVVPDVAAATQGLTNASGENLVFWKWNYCFDTNLTAEENIALHTALNDALAELQGSSENSFRSTVESRDFEREDFYSIYGGLFFLGVMLSIVFLFAAVLIIYYKQLSEGYEDQARFGIMQNVGMTKREIRKSINSQLLTVFFLPLLMAGLHLACAFPMIEKLLLLFQMNNRPLFICTTVGSLLIFAVFYAVVYRITSNSYYQIVGGAREKN